MQRINKALTETRGLTKQGPPGPPPRPGLQWNSQSHRWIRPQTGSGKTTTPRGSGKVGEDQSSETQPIPKVNSVVTVPHPYGAKGNVTARVTGRPRKDRERGGFRVTVRTEHSEWSVHQNDVKLKRAPTKEEESSRKDEDRRVRRVREGSRMSRYD